MEHQKHGMAVEWLVPLAFVFSMAWLIWQGPAFILEWGPENQQLSAQFARTDIAKGGSPLFGGFADIYDYTALVLAPILFVIGAMTVHRAPMEYEDWIGIDRISVFIGRAVMMLVVLLCCTMLYEVFVRYVLDNGTYWANELTLWLAGFVFLCSGLYAMQQRSHIRIYLLYDICPRWMQRLFDTISTVLIVLFAFFLVYGGYGEAFQKFMRWELFGTAFDPPIPATIKLAVLVVITLVAVQAVINLFADWNAEPVVHTAADDIDEDELAKLRASLGADGIGEMDVTRAAAQDQGRR
jgi:TRAP-type mannitol/chloroaromatic compound transport system permease small subunit